MPPDLKRIFSSVRRWSSDNRFVQLLNDRRVLIAGVVLFVLFSIVRILLSGLHTTIKFLSFALLAVVLIVLVWPYTEPLTNE